jgi:hypothetical protein
MKTKLAHLCLALGILILTSLACSLPFLSAPQPRIEGTVPLPENVTGPTPLMEKTDTESPQSSDLIRQGASRSRLDPDEIDDVAIGLYADSTICGEGYLYEYPDEGSEILLILSYPAALQLEQLDLYTQGLAPSIRYIEIFNSISGLGRLAYESGQPLTQQTLAEGPCAQRLSIPIQTDIEADTIFISFENYAGAAQLGVVEMLGRLSGYIEPPVFWRVSLPDSPIALAINEAGMTYAAVEPNRIYTYDIEGNPLGKIPVPAETWLDDIAADPFGNLVVVDSTYGWFIVISPEGEHLTVGGDSVFGAAAVSPKDGNLYLLMGSQIHIYTTDTGEFLRMIPLDNLHIYITLAFAPDGRLFLLRDFDWDAALFELDPLSGAEGDAIPLRHAGFIDTVARDFAIDTAGNFYILYYINAAKIAVHVLDPNGMLIKRFGKLTCQTETCPEGEFFDPCAIAVSPDGRFVLVADGFGNNATLTAFRLEEK